MSKRFIALFDLHYGRERKGRKLVEIHDPKALDAVLKFASDFKPHALVLGGDMADCGVVSHHNKGKPRITEGFRLLADFQGLRKNVLDPLEGLGAEKLIYHIGNHEDWVNQLVDEHPGLEGLVDVEGGLKLSRWDVIEQGGVSKLGKLHFLHGDQVKGGQYPARWAVDAYERSVRFGHFHTYQAYSKTNALDHRDIRTGVAVPALCRRDLRYGKGSPNKCALGFLWGYVHDDGTFNDYVTFIVRDRFFANGKMYRG